jgi:hypothetical protein
MGCGALLRSFLDFATSTSVAGETTKQMKVELISGFPALLLDLLQSFNRLVHCAYQYYGLINP